MAWVAVSEATTAHGKQQSITRITRTVTTVALLTGGAAIAAPPAPNQLPTGGQVAAGVAAIGTSGNTMTVTQTSDRAAINWNTFDIGSQAKVQFIQPSSSAVALNRVNSPDPSQIYGHLSANGQVYLINAAGVYFAPGAQVNVGGIVATTHQMSDAAFMAGKTTFDRNGSTGKVINEGTIQTSLNGYIAMLAPEVRNSGLLLAQSGTVAMAAGESITLNFGPTSKLESITVSAAQLDTLVENRAAIKAPNGLVILSARAANQLAASVVNSGTIEAKGVAQQGGRILLEGSTVSNTGTLDASSDTGQGGTIEINGKRVALSGTIKVDGFTFGGKVKAQATEQLTATQATIQANANQSGGVPSVQGGSIQLAANQLTITDSTLSADGDTGGAIQLTATVAQPDNPFHDPLNLPTLPATLAATGFTSINSRGRRGQGGNATLTGDSITLDGNTNINVSGATGGGNALIGGDWQGSNGTYQATTVYMGQNVTIDASATDNGNGGKVVLWSDIYNANSLTQVDGTIRAIGANGTGGQVETSGHLLGVNATASVQTGAGGEWLLDPADVTISNGGDSSYTNISGTWTPNSGVNLVTINNATLAAALNSGNVTVTAYNTGTQGGYGGAITVANPVSWTGSGNLSLYSTGVISINANINSTGIGAGFMAKASGPIIQAANVVISTNGGDVTLWSYANVAGVARSDGYINLYAGANITTSGGSITLGGGTNISTGYATGTADGSTFTIGIWLQGNQLDSGGGAITLRGQSSNSSLSEVDSGINIQNSTLNAGTGKVSLTGVGLGSGSANVQGLTISNLTITSANTATDAISLVGNTSGVTSAGTSLAINLGTTTLQATGQGGGILLNGTSGGTGTGYEHGVDLAGSSLFAASGPIVVISSNPNSGSSSNYANLYLGGNNFFGTNNATSSSANVTLRADALTVSGTNNNISTAGTLTIEPLNNSFTSALTFPISNLNLGSSISGLTIGKLGNGADITIGTATSIAGPITIYGGNLTLNAGLTGTATGGDITLWANSNNGSSGKILLNSGANISTSGGNITLGGGDDITNGFAVGNSGNSVGINLAGNTLNSGGGNIILRGMSANSSNQWFDFGINIVNSTLNAGTGKVALTGIGLGSSLANVQGVVGSNFTITSANTAADAISILGDTSNVTSAVTSLAVNFKDGTVNSIQATGIGGGIVINGTSGGTGTTYEHGVDLGNINLVAASGPIFVTSSNAKSGSSSDYANLYLGGSTTFGTNNATASTANVTLRADAMTIVGTNNITTNGTVTIESQTDSFTSALSFPVANLTLGSAISGLTLGKSTNTANMTIGGSPNISGPITVYGGNIAVNSNMTTTSTGAILLKAANAISTAANITIQTNNSSLVFWSNSNGSAAGGISLGNNITLNTANGSTTQTSGGGNIVMGGGSNAGNAPTGYATSGSAAGVALGTATIKTGGGNLSILGSSSSGAGIAVSGVLDVRSGQGAVTINGSSSASQGLSFTTSGLTIESSKSVGTAIDISGATTDVNSIGIFFNPLSSGSILSTDGGSISVTGSGNGTGIYSAGINYLSKSGSIILNGGANGITFAGSASTFGQLANTNVTSSSANIALIADVITRNTTPTFNTSGNVTIKSSSDSFTSAFSTTNMTFGSSLGSLTIGKSTNTQNITVANAISIAGGINVYGGNITLNAGLATTNATLGDISLTGNVNGSSSIALADNRTVTVNQSGSSSYGGTISGNGSSLVKTGNGTLTLSGANTYNGTTNITAGTLIVSGSLSDSTVVNVSSGANYSLSSTDTIGSFAGLGTINLGGYNLTTASNTSTIFDGVLAGNGNLTKGGNGTLTLNGTNTYNGTTTVNAGALALSSDANLGTAPVSATAGSIVLNGGTLQATANFTLNANRSISLGTSNGTFSVDPSITLNYAGIIASTGSMTKSGNGTLVLGGANSYSGNTTISAGTLIVNGTGSLGSGSYAGNISNSGNLSLNTSTAQTLSGVISGSGNLTQSGSGTLTLSGNSTYTGNTTIDSGTLQLNSGGAINNSVGIINNGTLIYNNGLVNTAALVSGTGNISVGTDSSTNSTLQLISTLNVTGALNVYSGNVLDLNGHSSPNAISIAGTGIGNAGALVNSNTTTAATQSGAVTLTGGARLGGNGSLTISGNIGGAFAVTKVGTGTTTLTGSNTYSGATTINAGTLQIGNGTANGSIAYTSSIVNNSILTFDRNDAIVLSQAISGTGDLTQAGSGTLTLTGTNSYTGTTTINAGTLQIGNGTESGTITNTSAIVNNGTLAYSNSGLVTLSQVISGNGGLTQDGSGTLTLTGTNTYAGKTTINAGTLVIGNGTANGSIANTSAIVNNGTLTYNRSDLATLSQVISGSGNLTQAGSGTLTLTGDNTYTGATTINAGTLQIGNGTANGAIASTTAIVNYGTLNYNRSDDVSVANNISGSGGFVKSGSNTLTLTGQQTYTGNTNVSAGAMVFTNNVAPTTSGFTGNGTVTIQPVSNGSFTNDLTSNYSFASTLSGLTLGSTSNTANIMIKSTTSIAGNIALYGGNVALNNALTATNSGIIRLQATSGNLTQNATGVITTAGLALLGGNATLTNTNNNVTTFAAKDMGNLSYVNAGNLSVGTVNPTGVNATGSINISTQSGDLSITEAIKTTSTAEDAIVLNAGAGTAVGTATGGNILISPNVTLIMGDGGRATLFTGSIADSTGVTNLVGSGTGHFRYNSNASTSNYNTTAAPLGAGVYAVYREQPTLTISTANESIVYGNSPNTTISSTAVNGDTLTQIFGTAPTVSVSGNTSTAGFYTASNHTLNISGASTNNLGYATPTVSNGTVEIAKANLTVSGTQVANTTYNNSTVASFSNNGTLVGIVTNGSTSDMINLTTAGNFSSKNVGTNLTVTMNNSISGTDADNYNLIQPTSITGNITPKTVTLSDTQVYSGGTAMTNVTIGGLIGNETLTYSAATANSSHVADNGSNFITNITLGNGTNGGLASNYQLPSLTTQSASNKVTIMAATVTLTATGNITKVYDGTANATLVSSDYTVSGLVDGDSLTLNNLSTAAYNSAHVATANNVSVSNLTLATVSGNNSSAVSDYDLQTNSLTWGTGGQASTNANITAATLTLTATGNLTKVYDGTTNATIAQSNYQITGFVAGDTAAALTNSAADYNNAHVVGATNVTASGIAISNVTGNLSSAASDYSLSTTTLTWGSGGQAGTNANITPAQLTVTGTTVANKTYDGNTTATLSNGTLVGAVAGDTLTLTQAGNFSSANAANNISVTANDSFTISSTNHSSVATDYSLTQPTGLTGNITPKTVTLSDTQVYSGSTAMTNVTIGGLVGNETLTYSAATANSSHVADNGSNFITNITLTNGIGANGGLSSNYQLPSLTTQSASNKVTITAATVTLTATGNITKVYDGTASANVAASYNVSGLLDGDSLTLNNLSTAAYNSTHVANATNVSVANLTLATVSGNHSSALSDYDLQTTSLTWGTGGQAGTNASITPATLTLTATGNITKLYDGTASANVAANYNVSGLVDGDSLTLNNLSTAAYNSAHVATANNVSVSNLTLATVSGNHSSALSDYDLQTTSLTWGTGGQSGTLANITPAPLGIAFRDTYNGGTGFNNVSSAYTLTGLQNGEMITSANITIANANVAYANNYVTDLSVVSGNASMSNYVLNNGYNATIGNTSNTVSLSTAPLTITAQAANMTYSGTGYTGGNVSYNGFVGSDNASSMTGYIAYSGDSQGATNVGNYTITASGQTNSNYNIRYDSGTLTIDPAPLGITATGVYNGTTTLTPTSYNVTGLVNGETLTSINAVTVSNANVAASTYIVDLSSGGGTANLSNYQITLAHNATPNTTTTNAFTMAKAALIVTADNAASFIGQSLPSSYNVSYNGFVGGQDASNAGLSTGTVANSATNISGAGTYTLTPSGFSASNYSITYVNGSYTIVPAESLLVQLGNRSTTYAVAGNLTPTSVQYMTGNTTLVNLTYVSNTGNNFTYNDGYGGNVSFTLSPTNATYSSSNNLNAASYQIGGSNLTQGGTLNLNGTGVYTGTLDVAKQALTASTSDVSKVYDGSTAMTGLNIGLSPVVSGDIVTANGVGAFGQSNVGNNISYNVSGLTLGGADANNYYLTGGTSFSGSNGVITAAPLTVTADNVSKTYGDTGNLASTAFTSSGLVAGQTIGSVTLTSTGATATANAANYIIDISNATGGTFSASNYNIRYVNGTLTVNPAPLGISAAG